MSHATADTTAGTGRSVEASRAGSSPAQASPVGVLPAGIAPELTDLLIVGASQSGVQLAASLRALGCTDHITLLGDEAHRPYQRPALSKEFLQGTMDKEKLIFRTAEYWEDHRIALAQDVRITEVERCHDGGGTAVSATGDRIRFRRLALTVGARARRLDVPGVELDGVVYLRNADDALKLKELAGGARDVVVIGGGFIGLEAAASMHAMGKRVTVLEYGQRLIGRAVGEATSEFFLQAHRERGIDVRLEARFTQITGDDGSVTGVQLQDGTVVKADIVLIGIGVVPNTELAESLGLAVDNGIRVDRHALASDGTTVAVGDVANLPNPMPGAPVGERIRLESVNNAVEHAKVAAYALMGRREEYTGTPWFWSNQADLKLQIAGLSLGHDRTLVRRDEEKGRFAVLYYRGEQIIAADCVNNPLDFMAVKSALSNGKNIPAEEASNPSVALKSIIRDV
ncbi:FAD-dependent oxidoreductase [Nesterenkonia sp. LB17]|uniref:NAD(P)/FAD-dependent oxidoreductase n=1 Tax=Nesterenkonia sp. LB17 TaxID=2901230 RepID=UPI001F4C9633|nr:FAD-dependent oxidoreductase [Nesterenkonia sp. LB17]MCH8564446.1 FAD-dependent oxidoreductase [Nesterenkonia sp. LB17]